LELFLSAFGIGGINSFISDNNGSIPDRNVLFNNFKQFFGGGRGELL
jgi:hypothetical protein